MNYTVIATKVDPQTKKQAQETAERLGMPLSVIIKAFIKQLIRTQSVAFDAYNEEPNEYFKSVIAQAKKNLIKGSHSPVFESGDEAVGWLEKQGL